jgi:hypothetical protein
MFFGGGVRENQNFLSTVEPRNVHVRMVHNIELLQEGGGGGEGGYGRCLVGKVFVY